MVLVKNSLRFNLIKIPHTLCSLICEFKSAGQIHWSGHDVVVDEIILRGTSGTLGHIFARFAVSIVRWRGHQFQWKVFAAIRDFLQNQPAE